MSKLRKEIIECPHCRQKGEYDLWESVNVDIDPELKEKIFSDEIFMFHCPHCGEVTGIPAGMLYHDMKNHFMLFFKFFRPGNFDNAPLEIAERFGLQEAYRFRGVFGLQRFKEKIMILELGLDDVAVERQKYMIKHLIMPEIKEKGYNLFFAGTEAPSEKFPYGQIGYFYNDEETGRAIKVGFAMESYYEHKLACGLDPRMKVTKCECVDEEWMANKMKGE